MEKQQEQQMIRAIAEGLAFNNGRTPVLRRPSDYGMEYKDVFFPAIVRRS